MDGLHDDMLSGRYKSDLFWLGDCKAGVTTLLLDRYVDDVGVSYRRGGLVSIY
jgi:hypothetical protein